MDRSSGEQINVYRDDFFGGDRHRRRRGRRGRGRRPVQLVLLRQHHPDLPGRRADRRAVPVPGPPVRPGLLAERLRALRGRLRPARRPPPRQGDAPAGRRRPGGERGVELRQGPVGLPVRHRVRPASPTPLVRDAGDRRAARGRPGARRCCAAAEGLRKARDGPSGVGVLTGGRLTVEDAYAYAKFARIALGTNDIDFRARPAVSARGGRLPAASVAGGHRRDLRRRGERAVRGARRARAGGGVPDPLPAPAQGARARRSCRSPPSRRSRPGASRSSAPRWSPAVPGDEARLLTPTRRSAAALSRARRAADRRRAAGDRARWTVRRGRAGRADRRPLAWVPAAGRRPRRGRRRLPAEPAARRPPGHRRGGARRARPRPGTSRPARCPARPAGTPTRSSRRPRPAQLGGLLVGRRRPGRPGRPAAGRAGARQRCGFLVSLELRQSAVTRRADVVLPVAPAVEKSGTYMDWEGRLRTVRRPCCATTAMTDGRVLDAIAALMDVHARHRRRRSRSAASWAPCRPAGADRPAAPTVAAGDAGRAGPARGRAGHLAPPDRPGLAAGRRRGAGRHRPAAGGADRQGPRPSRSASPTATRSRSAPTGARSPCRPRSPTCPTRVVWLPTNSPGSTVRRSLGVTSGAVVRLTAGEPGPILAAGG